MNKGLPEYIKDEDIVGVRTTSTLQVTWNSRTNKWDAFSKIIQERTKDGVNWEQKAIDTQTSKEDLEKAISDIYLTVNLYLESVNGDLFSEEQKINRLEA